MSQILRPAIQAAITAKGFTQAEVSKHSGVTQPRISAYLSGARDLTGRSLDKLLAVLGLQVK